MANRVEDVRRRLHESAAAYAASHQEDSAEVLEMEAMTQAELDAYWDEQEKSAAKSMARNRGIIASGRGIGSYDHPEEIRDRKRRMERRRGL